MLVCFFFFFSSRRRHTRCSRDWSSDVCSSDLKLWPVPQNLRGQLLEILSRSQRHHRESRRQRFHHAQALPPNRARGTEYRNLSHPSLPFRNGLATGPTSRSWSTVP